MDSSSGRNPDRVVARYCYAIAAVAALSAAVLVAWTLVRYQGEVRARDRLQQFHVRSVMLSSEISTQVTRLERALSTQDVAAAGGDRRASIARGSIARTLDSLVLLQEEHDDARFAGTVERTRSRHARLREALNDSTRPALRILADLESLAIAARQLHELHSIALETSLAEMTASGARRTWRFAGVVAVILTATVALILRLLREIRDRLRRHRETEKALLERERQLQHAQKIQALGTLVGGVAHDFNNILTVILGNAQALRSQLVSGEPGSLCAEEILKAGERAASLTRQLLAYSRYELVERGLVDLNPALQDLQPLLRRLVRADVALELELGEGVGLARIDPVQLEQVLMNLATNAVHAMPDGGRLEIGTAAVELDPAEAASRGMAPGRYSRIRVEDSGCGMSPDVRSRAFEPFFTTKERGEGTGLGLSIVHGIVAGSDGRVLVDSEPGRGTRLDVYLPHEDRRDEEPDETPEQVDALAGTETLLLVEDDDQVRKLAASGLRAQGYDVLVCSSGPAAVRVCREHPGPIQVILTDVVLPELRGPEIVERVRAIRPDIAAVYISGYTEEGLLERVHSSTDPLVPKPFKMNDLLRAVRQQADRFRERQTARS